MRAGWAAAPAHAASTQGIVWLLVGVSCYAVMDAFSRAVAPVYGVPLVMSVRFAVHTFLMLAWLGQRRWRGQTVAHRSTLRSQLLRGALLFCSGSLAVAALQGMPVAEYTAVVMLTPVAVTLVAAWVLRQPTTALQWALVVGGLVGALVVIRPGSGLFDAAALLALGVVGCNTLYQSITNHVGRQEDAVKSNFHAGWIGLVLSLAWLAWQAPVSVEPSMLSLASILSLLAVGVLATAAQLAVIKALSCAPAGVLMPFAYAQIGIAALAGWWLLGDRPDAFGWLGMALIALCGVAGAWLAARGGRHGPVL